MINNSKQKFVVSYGGGINSTAMIIWLIKNKRPIDYVIFSDTGNEVPETYQYITQHMKPYLQKHNISFVTVYNYRKISLWTRCIIRRVFPDMYKRWCTRDFKVRPIHRFYRTLKSHIIEYMGIDYGEIKRMKLSIDDHITKDYPLIDNKIDRDACIAIITQAKMPIPVKSGCFFCPYNSKERWVWLKKNHPDLYKLSEQLEKNSKHYPHMKLINLGVGSNEMCDGVCMT